MGASRNAIGRNGQEESNADEHAAKKSDSGPANMPKNAHMAARTILNLAIGLVVYLVQLLLL